MRNKVTLIIGFFACLYVASWLEYWQRPVGLRDLMVQHELREGK